MKFRNVITILITWSSLNAVYCSEINDINSKIIFPGETMVLTPAGYPIDDSAIRDKIAAASEDALRQICKSREALKQNAKK